MFSVYLPHTRKGIVLEAFLSQNFDFSEVRGADRG